MPQAANPPDGANLPLAGDGPTTPPAPPNLASDLARAMGFSLGALPANRAGQMTDVQAATVQARAVKAAWPAVFMVAAYGLFLIVRPTTGRYGQPLVWNATTTLAGRAVGIVIVAQLALLPIRTWADARSQQVLKVEGAITKTKPTGRTTVYLIRVDRVSFMVPLAGFETLPDSGGCRAYYAPLSSTLLNIELV